MNRPTPLSPPIPPPSAGRRPLLALTLLAALLAGCESGRHGPSARSAARLDEWGNRPGPRGFKTVVVDAGHGGRDTGARSRRGGLVEKNLALDTAHRLRRELDGQFRVVMTRQSDVFVELDDRVAIANRHPDAVLVSIHFNDCRASWCCGPETYWWRVDSYTLARRVERCLSAVSPYDRNRDMVRRRLRLTRNPDIPCILVECGYLSNPRESRSIASAHYRSRLANAIAGAIREQASAGDGDLGPLPRFIKAPPSRNGDARGS